jgi:nucleoside-diphosphate-sugar epimerase
MSRVLLTGSTGFVGAQVLKSLLSEGVEVTATLRPGQTPPKGVTPIYTPDLFAERASFWQDACAGHGAVIHVAWYAEPGQYLQSTRNLDCLAGTIQLFQGAMSAGVAHFQGIGTCFEYDLATEALARHTPLAVSAPLKPATAYGAAKAATYLALSRNCGNMAFAWSRLFYLQGAGEDARRLVPYIHEQLAAGALVELTSGVQWRDFLDVAEAGRQIAEVTLRGLTGPINICSGQAITIAELALNIATRFGRPDLIRLGALPDRADDPPYVVGLPSLKARS